MGLPVKNPSAPSSRQQGGQQIRHLKKGELLFAEGENSRSMYFVKTGMIRLFKKKGESQIELDTIRSGQVLGELAFLDGNPRSASGEALTECNLVEISGTAFQEVLTRLPDWLKILLKTVVSRLRTASTRIRQLETASSAYDYSDKDGKRSAHYIYLSPTDILKIASGLLLVASRNGTNTDDGIDVRVGLLQRYVNQIMGIPVAKITTFMDLMEQVGLVAAVTSTATPRTILKDANFLEQLITYLNEENLIEPSKRHDISLRGFFIMSLIAKHLGRYQPDPASGNVIVNIGEIKKLETAENNREPFRIEEFMELVKHNYASAPNVKSQDEVFTSFNMEAFVHSYRMQRVVIAIQAINEQKRKAGGYLR
ncbi:MAG: Crp/Fnr family transcriptional regulator [Bdellovibrionota bacterium]